ncbi:hypothetical protein BHF72_1878 [Cloacibacterium normanense]|uniref:Uncharacterized protein n=1 Tax=Cloacibacterium normanense TaxID=237258 RepID=A0A1E5UFD6_9FLAO|nr:hypothetical protein BHF72_1878 [Cloacibacterium normanense]SDO78173.1 hypothetical protein SAMN04489756_11811 [Cloacibacterium normanense]
MTAISSSCALIISSPNFLTSGSTRLLSSTIRIAPAWCGIMDFRNWTSPTAVCCRIPDQNSTIISTPRPIRILLSFLLGYIFPIISSSMINIEEAIRPAIYNWFMFGITLASLSTIAYISINIEIKEIRSIQNNFLYAEAWLYCACWTDSLPDSISCLE